MLNWRCCCWLLVLYSLPNLCECAFEHLCSYFISVLLFAKPHWISGCNEDNVYFIALYLIDSTGIHFSINVTPKSNKLFCTIQAHIFRLQQPKTASKYAICIHTDKTFYKHTHTHNNSPNENAMLLLFFIFFSSSFAALPSIRNVWTLWKFVAAKLNRSIIFNWILKLKLNERNSCFRLTEEREKQQCENKISRRNRRRMENLQRCSFFSEEKSVYFLQSWTRKMAIHLFDNTIIMEAIVSQSKAQKKAVLLLMHLCWLQDFNLSLSEVDCLVSAFFWHAIWKKIVRGSACACLSICCESK